MYLNRIASLTFGAHSNLYSPDIFFKTISSPSSVLAAKSFRGRQLNLNMSTAKHLNGVTNPLCTLMNKSHDEGGIQSLAQIKNSKIPFSSCQIANKPNLNKLIDTNIRRHENLCPAISRYNQIPQSQTTRSVHTLSNSLNFRSMAGIQKLATEPTREHIENIKQVLRNTNAKDNNDQEISLTKDSTTGIAMIRIKSAAKNGISAKMMCDFLDVIDQLYLWEEGKGVIIYGHNNFFCSGGDLVSVRELANYEDGLKMATLMQYNLARLQTLPMITMALIQGKAIGGGAEIAATMDLRTITKSAKIGYVHARIGIVAAWGGGCRLVQLVGPSRAIDMMSSGRLVDSNEALNMGLVNHILDDSDMSCEQVMDEAKKYLCSHLIGVKSTIIAIKGIINAARTLPLEQALVAEAQLLSSTWGKPAHIEALNKNVKHRGDNND